MNRDLDAVRLPDGRGIPRYVASQPFLTEHVAMLETNLEISTALPCRIALYEDGGITKLATIKPTAMLALYSAAGLESVARDVEVTLETIMAEAATG